VTIQKKLSCSYTTVKGSVEAGTIKRLIIGIQGYSLLLLIKEKLMNLIGQIPIAI
jgi:hypothetical protein